MNNEPDDEVITNAINTLTEKLSKTILKDFLKLPKELQMNIVLIKSAQLLLANILCHIASNKEELKKISEVQGAEISELILNCAFTGFAGKFDLNKH